MLQRIRNISRGTWMWFVCCILTTSVLLAFQCNCMVFNHVNGNSMNPTLEDGAVYLGTKLFSLRSGDIVVADSDILEMKIVKRVIAVPGDTVAIENGTVYRNGLALTEDYIAEPMVTEDMAPFVLEEGLYFLLGDNRNNSTDSRHLGPISRDAICYEVFPQTRPIAYVAKILYMCLVGVAIFYLPDQEVRWITALLSRRKQRKENCAIKDSDGYGAAHTDESVKKEAGHGACFLSFYML